MKILKDDDVSWVRVGKLLYSNVNNPGEFYFSGWCASRIIWRFYWLEEADGCY